MSTKYYKNDYAIYRDLITFANSNPLGRLAKPFMRGVYRLVKEELPQPRDFLIHSIPKGGQCCEVGVWDGALSERILKKARPKALYLIDPWLAITGRSEAKYSQAREDERYQAVLKKFEKPIALGTVIVKRTTSDAAVEDFEPNVFDFVYIDGDHSYTQVKKDLENYYPKVKVDGILSGDDYHLEEVRRAVDEFAKEHEVKLTVHNRQFIFRNVRKPIAD